MRAQALLLLIACAAACGDAKPAADAANGERPAAANSASASVSPEAQALADSLLPRLERLSGLKALRGFTVRSQTSQQVRTYVESRLNAELPADVLASVHDTYALLGLIPDSLNLRALLLDLYTEQVIGYYDPDASTMFVLAGADKETLRPVLAHELVHALQDQHVKVDSLIDSKRGADRSTAAHAALEGHATIVMFALLAEDAEKRVLDPATLPNPSEQLRTGLETQNGAYPVFARAPSIIRETVLFPYIGGTDFVYRLWSSDTTPQHAAPIGALLPQSTEQILHTDRRFIAQRDTPTEVRFTSSASAGWRVRRDETFGELESAIILEQYLGPPGRAFAQGWDGDRYQLLQDAAGSRALVWYSIWDSPAAADIFVSGMKQIAQRRRNRVMTVDRVAIEGRPGVRIVDTGPGASLAQVPLVSITRTESQP